MRRHGMQDYMDKKKEEEYCFAKEEGKRGRRARI